MPQPMKNEEIRQLRAWAIETALGKQQLQQKGCEEHHTIDIKDVISDARALVAFVRSSA